MKKNIQVLATLYFADSVTQNPERTADEVKRVLAREFLARGVQVTAYWDEPVPIPVAERKNYTA